MEKPNIFVKIKNFSIALYNHILDGFKKVSEKEQKSRIIVCSVCEFKDRTKDECSICGCYLPIKTSWKDQSCPKGKW